MEKSEFFELFKKHLEIAAEKAEAKHGFTIPRIFKIALMSFGYHDKHIDVESAFELLWIDENSFYAIIDIAVIEVIQEAAVIFVRVSGHEPRPFDQTWNQPIGNGPFNQLISATIKGKF